MVHGISSFLGMLQLWFRFHSFTHFPLKGSFSVSQVFPLKSEWNFLTPQLLHFICQSIVTGIILRSVVRRSSNQAPMKHGCGGFWVSGWLNTMKLITEYQYPRRSSSSSSSRNCLLQWNVNTFVPLSLKWVVFTESRDTFKASFPLFLCKVIGFFLMKC